MREVLSQNPSPRGMELSVMFYEGHSAKVPLAGLPNLFLAAGTVQTLDFRGSS